MHYFPAAVRAAASEAVLSAQADVAGFQLRLTSEVAASRAEYEERIIDVQRQYEARILDLQQHETRILHIQEQHARVGDNSTFIYHFYGPRIFDLYIY